MEINHKLNCHGKLHIRILIQDGQEELFIRAQHRGEQIYVCDNSIDTPFLLFCGLIDEVVSKMENQVMTADIYAFSHSIILDLPDQKKYRSFQDPKMTFVELVEQVLQNSNAEFTWNLDWEQTINRPYIQYDETDWEFLLRISSQFHASVVVNIASKRPVLYFGLKPREECVLDIKDIRHRGLSDLYDANIAHDKRKTRNWNSYVLIKNTQLWQMNDFIQYEGNSFFVYDRKVRFEEAALQYRYILGTAGTLSIHTIVHTALTGIQLTGTVRKAERESVYIQLDIDEEEQAYYAWPWVPETGNLCYCMPEVDSRAILYFPTDIEGDGLATHIIRTNGNSGLYQEVQNREFTTIHDKNLRLHPERIRLEAKDRVSTLSLADKSGIHIDSQHKILLNAQGEITFKATDILVQAPAQIGMQTPDSNIEMNKHLNFYAKNSVYTESVDDNYAPPHEEKQENYSSEPNHWKLSYAAMSAIPTANFSKIDQTYVLDIVGMGALPKMVKGTSILTMREVMDGKKLEETTFPKSFQSFENYTFKGGYPMPKKEKLDMEM